MGFLKNLFRKGEEPNKAWSDDLLGMTTWSDDDEAWHGEYQGQCFSIAYEWTTDPDPDLVAYAKEILKDHTWFEQTLEKEKIAAKAEYGDELADEIQGLSIGTIGFLIQRGQNAILASLEGGQDYRAWRIEFLGREFAGIGFDS